MAYDVDQLISTAQKRLEQARTFNQHNLDEAETDLLFRVLKQWDESVVNDRSHADPPRPMITVDRLTAFCNQVTNEIRQNKPQPKVSPRGNGANKPTAEVIEGKVRAILYDSDSELAFQEAAKYAVACGCGNFRLDPEVVDEETGQQTLRVNPIYDPSTVYWDPFAKRPDKADARWCLVVNVMSRIEYKERWPDATATAADFFDKDRSSQGWMDPSGDKESVMVAEYWCVEKLNSDSVALGEEINDADNRPRTKAYKDRGQKYRVVCHIIDGVEELEPAFERPGKFIPIFQVEGDSFWVKGKRYISSLIRAARDIQRLYNWEATKEVEILAMQATSPYFVTPKMVEGHEGQWQSAPNQNYFYLKFNHDTNEPGGPKLLQATAKIMEISQAKAMTAQEMKDVIGMQDPNLGRAQSPNQSGIAINALRSEGDLGTYHYQDNLARTMKHFCKVLVSWIPFYHDIEEEMLILKADMTEANVTVNTVKPFTDPKTGETYWHKLTEGDYETVVEVGPSYATAREEEANFYSQIITAVPDAFWVIGDMLIRSRDSAGADVAADRLKRAIALKLPGLIQDGPNQMPPGAAAQVQGMQAQMQQMGQQLQQLQLALKVQAAPKQIEAQSRMQVEGLKARTQIMKALIDAKTKIHNAALEHGHAMYATNLGEATDAIEHLTQMLHESELAPGPDQGSPGIHPTMPPQPMPPGGAQQPGPGV